MLLSFVPLWGFCVRFIFLLSIAFCPFKFCNHLDEEERASCFIYLILLVSCDRYCSVALPHCAVGWSVVGNYGISWS